MHRFPSPLLSLFLCGWEKERSHRAPKKKNRYRIDQKRRNSVPAEEKENAEYIPFFFLFLAERREEEVDIPACRCILSTFSREILDFFFSLFLSFPKRNLFCSLGP